MFIKLFRLLYRIFFSLIRISQNIKKNKLKIVYKIIYVQKQSSRGVLQQRHSTNTKRTQKRTNGQKCDPNKATLQLYWNHTHARMRPREFTSHPQNTSPQENTSERLLLYVKIVLKDLNYKELLFTNFKRNLLTIKNR